MTATAAVAAGAPPALAAEAAAKPKPQRGFLWGVARDVAAGTAGGRACAEGEGRGCRAFLDEAFAVR